MADVLSGLCVLDLDRSAQQTSAAGGDQSSLLSGHGVAVDGRGLSDVLVVSSSVGVVCRSE